MTSNKRFIIMNTKDGSIRLTMHQNYWKALKSGQKWFGSQTGIRVWEDKLSTR